MNSTQALGRLSLRLPTHHGRQISLRTRPNWTSFVNKTACTGKSPGPVHVRTSSTSSSSPTDSSTTARGLWKLTTVGIYIGVGSLVYWLYTEWQQLSSAWPEDVKPDLRQALLTRNKGDWATSELYFRSALEKLRTKTSAELQEDALLKISGVEIALADVLERGSQFQKAYDIYSDSFQAFQRRGPTDPLTGPEIQRAISIAYRLGELAEQLKYPEDEEKYLSWAVTAIIHKTGLGSSSNDEKSQSNGNDTELRLPAWASVTDMAAPLDALASFYARQGKTDYALPLYLHAASILIPPPPKTENCLEDRCRGAIIMLKISDLLAQGPKTPESAHQAEAWAQKSLSILENTRGRSWTKLPLCEEALIAAYHGVAGFREMAGDKPTARKLYIAALKQARALNLADEVKLVEQCILDMDSSNSPPPSSA